jgi:AraC-like DNA-binding protein
MSTGKRGRSARRGDDPESAVDGAGRQQLGKLPQEHFNRAMPAPGVADPLDWDEASRAIGDAYFPHELHPLTQSTAANVVFESAEIGPVRIIHLGWGALVTVDTAHPGGYAVNTPISGRLESMIGRCELEATPDCAVIYPPDTPTCLRRWDPSLSILGVRFDRDYLHREMLRLLAEPLPRLPERLDLTERPGANWLQLVRSMSIPSVAEQHPLVREQLCGAITTAFVLAASPDADDGHPPSRPRIVKRVLDEMHDGPGRPWTAGDMAEVAGVSIRRLQEGFRDYVGASPRECLTDIRLTRVREDLMGGADEFTVADVAMRWGLMHTGRFAAAYRSKYGEAPSETLRAYRQI